MDSGTVHTIVLFFKRMQGRMMLSTKTLQIIMFWQLILFD